MSKEILFKLIMLSGLFFFFAFSSSGEIIVGVHYYPWYRPGNFQLGSTVRALPAIGPYDTSNPSVVSQHLDQAVYAGIDVFFLEWTGPQGEAGGNEYDIDNGFLPALNSKPYVQFCIFYDQAVRMYWLGIPEDYRFNFNWGPTYNAFVSDLYHIQTKYFSHPRYFRVNGAPVVWLYLERVYTGDWRSAITQVRNNAGGNIYLIADDLWNTLYPEPRCNWRWNYFDAISCYGISLDSYYDDDRNLRERPIENMNVKEVANLAIPTYIKWLTEVEDCGLDFFLQVIS